MGQADYGFHGIDGADRIRGIANRDQLRAVVDFAREVGQVEGATFFVNFSPADRDTFFFESEPRGDVGVVIETGDQDFVAGAEVVRRSHEQWRGTSCR